MSGRGYGCAIIPVPSESPIMSVEAIAARIWAYMASNWARWLGGSPCSIDDIIEVIDEFEGIEGLAGLCGPLVLDPG